MTSINWHAPYYRVKNKSNNELNVLLSKHAQSTMFVARSADREDVFRVVCEKHILKIIKKMIPIAQQPWSLQGQERLQRLENKVTAIRAQIAYVETVGYVIQQAHAEN